MMLTMTLEEVRNAAKAQSPSSVEVVYKCPMCGTLQSGNDLIAAGAGEDYEAVSKYAGFSCVGRFTGKGGPSKEKGKNHGCNWTLGGLFQMHEFEVVTPDGNRHPLFELASKDEAEAHRLAHKGAKP
ncbi:VVA0879 family protein [Halopseudomonas sp.]|uniref:VVA0879 family protein n=1 Tax=Halopseudomonas sp. TaxID=2901191 RepID=UPI0030014244